ncbi:hypothetical protein LUZ60_011706 [Juncus effusus]|nr:hypothetical protein LUZ60_011706 [Juncus effusus]
MENSNYHHRDQPAFLKQLKDDEEFSSHLRIPNAVLTDIVGDISNVIYLKGPLSTELHEIGVKLGKKSIYLTKGWKEFAEMHALQISDMLIFWYEGWSMFKVEIFDKKGSMKERNEEEESLSSGQINNIPIRMIKKNMRSNTYLSQRRDITDKEREAAKSRAKDFRSGKPFFEMGMKDTSVYRHFYLRLPTPFAKENLPHEFCTLELKLPGGSKKWGVNCRYTNGGEKTDQPHWRINKGWRQFSIDNNLEEGDHCVFEMIGKKEVEEKIKVWMIVRIFRVVNEIVPLLKVKS